MKFHRHDPWLLIAFTGIVLVIATLSTSFRVAL